MGAFSFPGLVGSQHPVGIRVILLTQTRHTWGLAVPAGAGTSTAASSLKTNPNLSFTYARVEAFVSLQAPASITKWAIVVPSTAPKRKSISLRSIALLLTKSNSLSLPQYINAKPTNRTHAPN